MYHHIRGKLTHSSPALAVIEAGGVGYAMAVSLATHNDLPPVGKDCMLLTHLSIRETEHVLYGFATEGERGLFKALISINGVGPATALQILSGTTPHEFARALETQDHTALKKIKGIGEKTAKRIILELKGTDAIAMLGSVNESGDAPPPASDTALAARQALETLGIPAREAAARVEKVLGKNKDLPLEEIIRAALQ